MLDVDLLHREVADVRCREAGTDAHRSSGDQAVGLVERHASPGKVPPPPAGPRTLCDSEWRQPQTSEQPVRSALLVRTQAPVDLLDRDDADPGFDAASAEPEHAICGRAAPERVDEDRRVEQEPGHSAGSAVVAAALSRDPPGGIVVPVVPTVLDGAERRDDVVPPPLVVEPATDELRDEGAPTTGPGAPVELRHEFIVQRYVHTHVPRIAHKLVDGT